MHQLILGCGQYQNVEGAEHQDIIPYKQVNHCFDLNQQTWPLKRDYYDKVICHHVVEHLWSLIHFMDRAWDIVKHGGVLEIETPNAGVNPDLEFCDPSHVRCFRPHSFINYFTREGVEKFHYTEKAWELSVETFQLELPNDCIRVIATPIK